MNNAGQVWKGNARVARVSRRVSLEPRDLSKMHYNHPSYNDALRHAARLCRDAALTASALGFGARATVRVWYNRETDAIGTALHADAAFADNSLDTVCFAQYWSAIVNCDGVTTGHKIELRFNGGNSEFVNV